MPERSAELFAAINARSQKLLLEFLHADLDLAFTFVQTGSIEVGSDDSHAKAAFQKAAVALDTIRRFQGRVEDVAEWSKINDRAAQLETLLGQFRESS
jgi:hypothetical protein